MAGRLDGAILKVCSNHDARVAPGPCPHGCGPGERSAQARRGPVSGRCPGPRPHRRAPLRRRRARGGAGSSGSGGGVANSDPREPEPRRSQRDPPDRPPGPPGERQTSGSREAPPAAGAARRREHGERGRPRCNGAGPRGSRPPPLRNVQRSAPAPPRGPARPRAAPRPPTFHLQEPLACPSAPHPGGATRRFPREPGRGIAGGGGDGRCPLMLGPGPAQPFCAERRGGGGHGTGSAPPPREPASRGDARAASRGGGEGWGRRAPALRYSLASTPLPFPSPAPQHSRGVTLSFPEPPSHSLPADGPAGSPFLYIPGGSLGLFGLR